MVQNGFFYISRSEYWSYLLQSKNAKLLLSKGVDKDRQMDLFNEFVQVVNIETSSYCNRRCSYCPIANKPRQQEIMRGGLFKKILSELRDIDYRGMIKLSLFNEPLADRDILDKIKMVKEYLPISYVQINSNGDYLDIEYLEDLAKAGIDEMLITQHMLPSEIYSDDLAERKLRKFVKKLGIEYEENHRIPNHNITLDCIYMGIRLLIVTNNWIEDGTDRGGEIEGLSVYDRKQPCMTPFREVVIDVNGNVRFCWNLFIDSGFVANLKQDSILEVYFSDKMVDIRRNHFDFSKKDKPCDTCNTFDYSSIESDGQRKELLL